MTWNQIVRIHVFEGRNDLPNVLVRQRWHDVKAADDRMYFLDAGGGLRLFDCIDDATVTAGGDYDQTVIAFRSSAPYCPAAVSRVQKQSSPPMKKGRPFLSLPLFAERKPTSPPK